MCRFSTGIKLGCNEPQLYLSVNTFGTEIFDHKCFIQTSKIKYILIFLVFLIEMITSVWVLSSDRWQGKNKTGFGSVCTAQVSLAQIISV